jgi:hypothetical protein
MRFFSAKTDKSPKLRNIETWNTRLDSTLTAEAKRVHFQKHMYPIMLIKDIKSVEVQADGAHGCDENADVEKNFGQESSAPTYCWCAWFVPPHSLGERALLLQTVWGTVRRRMMTPGCSSCLVRVLCQN